MGKQEHSDADATAAGEPARVERRSFLRGVLATLGLAAAGVAGLGASPAAAAHTGHCSAAKTYSKLSDSWCSGGIFYVDYVYYCSVCLGYCKSKIQAIGCC